VRSQGEEMGLSVSGDREADEFAAQSSGYFSFFGGGQ